MGSPYGPLFKIGLQTSTSFSDEAFRIVENTEQKGFEISNFGCLPVFRVKKWIIFRSEAIIGDDVSFRSEKHQFGESFGLV